MYGLFRNFEGRHFSSYVCRNKTNLKIPIFRVVKYNIEAITTQGRYQLKRGIKCQLVRKEYSKILHKDFTTCLSYFT